MPRKRCSRSPPAERRSDGEDDDYYLEEGRGPQEPQHRNAANARERARMRVLSKAFCRLKTTLPWVPADTKLSKLDTLRLAASYIAHLRALLHDEPRTAAQMFPHPLNLAWPFTFQHGGGTIGCSLTRWPSNSEAASTPTGVRSHLLPKESQDYGRTPEQRGQDYPENGYEREYPEAFDSATSSGHQYCNYVCKDNYYDVRNSYTDNLLHDT